MAMFDAPIPGQSLTMTPKNAPWENPPQMNTVEEVVPYYIQKLSNQAVMDDFGALVDAGVPLQPIVEGLYMTGVVRGMHTLDVGLLIAPVIKEYLTVSLSAMGYDIPAEKDVDAEATEKERNRFITAVNARLASGATQDEGTQMIAEASEAMGGEPVEQEAPMEEAMPAQEETPAPAMGRGLMAKGM